MEKEDLINHPSHYVKQGVDGLEPIDLLENYAGNIFNILKYIIRAGEKKGSSKSQDLGKALWYCTRTIGNCERYGRFCFAPNCLHAEGLTFSEKKLIEHFEETHPILKGLFDCNGRISAVKLCNLQRNLENELKVIKNETQN